VQRVGQLAGERAERPVGRVGRPAEQRQSDDEADIGQSQVADVVIGDGLGAQMAVADHDVEDQGVAKDAQRKRQQVGDEYCDSRAVGGRVDKDELSTADWRQGRVI